MQFFYKKTNITLFLIVFLFLLSFLSYKTIFSGASDNIIGYAWGAGSTDQGDNFEQGSGMGWLSFNCVNEAGSCGTGENYGVNINTDTNLVTGYAWSPNYGWLKFGGLSGFPVDNGYGNATFVGDHGEGFFKGDIVGWARFCSPTSNPDNCSGFFENDQNGGWDGWVSLNGENYKITIENTTLIGHAWGGYDNNKNIVGWIDLNGVTIQTGQGVLDFYPSPVFATAPDFETTLHWNKLDENIKFENCTASSEAPEWQGEVESQNEQLPASRVVSVPSEISQYTLTCKGDNGIEYISTISVARNTGESLTLNNTRVINGLTTLSWRATNIEANSCNASTVNPSSGINWSNDNPKIPPTDSDTTATVYGSMAGVEVNAVLPAKTTYRLSCTGKYSGLPVSASLDLHTQSGASGFTSVPKYQEN